MLKQREITVTVTYNELGVIIDTKAEPRKKGKWIGKEQYSNSPEYFSWECSCCGCFLESPELEDLYHFCPMCGADMREGDAE